VAIGVDYPGGDGYKRMASILYLCRRAGLQQPRLLKQRLRLAAFRTIPSEEAVARESVSRRTTAHQVRGFTYASHQKLLRRNTIGAHYNLSTASTSFDDKDETNNTQLDVDKERRRASAALKRRKKISAARKQLREMQAKEKPAEQRPLETKDNEAAEVTPLLSISRMRRHDFEVFFDETESQFGALKVEELVQTISKVMPKVSLKKCQGKSETNAKNDSAPPLSTVLSEMLHATEPTNTLQIKVLEFVLSGKRAESADLSKTKTSDAPESETIKEKFVETLLALKEVSNQDAQALNMNKESPREEEKLVAIAAASNPFEKELEVTVTKKRKKRSRRGTNYVFEAIPLIVNTSASGLDHMVFVDNLPIDITVEGLNRLYSRFGDLASIRIFNQRPELDPGPLKKAELIERLKRSIKSVSAHGTRWERPCSPVYALLTYTEEKGYREAMDDALRIFGMVIQKHPVRSIRPSDMTRLYIEEVPDGQPCIDFEHKLGRALDPDHYICLAAGQNNRAMVGRCEIKFPSFEDAYQAFQKLEQLDIIQDETNDCRINWRKSPEKAHLWWTRKLGFD